MEIVIIVNGIESVHELVNVTIEHISLESSKNVEIRPGVEVEANFQLFFVYDTLFIKVVNQTIKYL